MLLLACSGAATPAPAAPAGTAPVAAASQRTPAPRYAAEVVAVDFRHPEREAALAALMPALAERVDAFFAAKKPPSLAVAVIADGEARLRRVLGSAHVLGNVAATPRTLYPIGSLTKTFTAALVLSLRDEGRLSLDAPAEQYWPELGAVEYPFPDAARITVRHLLTHTSGLPRLGNFDYTKPVAFAPERGFGVVVLANASDVPVAALQDELVQLAAAALEAREQRPAPELVAALNAFGASLGSCPASA